MQRSRPPVFRRLFGACLFWSCLLIGFSVNSAQAAKNWHALVIGNANYRTGKLRNPVNDAQTMASVLKGLGFQVTTLTDSGLMKSEDTILKFSRDIGEDGVAFFFFAGHGVQVKGENYLIPTDARIREEFEVRHQCISLGLILDALENSRSNLNVVVLDCCRDNPFARSWTRSSRGGLAPTTEIPEGTLIAFATPPGQTAADGNGTNSPFTEELAKALKQRPKDGLLLRDAFFQASRNVKQKAGQSPWVNMEASLSKFYLTRPATGGAPVPNAIEPTLPALTPSLADSSLPPTPSETVSPPAKVPGLQPTLHSSSLERQAGVYLRGGDYDHAIEAFTAIINDPVTQVEIRQRARKARGSAFLSRGRGTDLERAIIDHKAAGLPGIRIPLRADSASLMVGKENRGRVTRNQILLVTLSQGDWLWVTSVNDDESLSGYVRKSQVLATAVVPSPPAQAAQPQTSVTHRVARPANGASANGVTNIGTPGIYQPGTVVHSSPVNPQQNIPNQNAIVPHSQQPQGTIITGQPNYTPSVQTQTKQTYTQPTQNYSQNTYVPSNQNRSYNQSTNQRNTGTLRESFRDSFIKGYNRANSILRPPVPQMTPMRSPFRRR